MSELDIQPEVATVEAVTETAPEQQTTETVEKSPAETPAVEGATTSDEAQAEEAKKKSGFQKRIDELTRQKYERDAQIAQLQSQIAASNEQSLNALAESTKPTIEKFDYDAERFAQAYTKWVDQQQKAKEDQVFQQQQQAQAYHQQIQSQQKIQEKIYKAQAEYPDFMATINDPSLPNLQEVNKAAYEAVVESDNMGAVAMHLAKNPEKIYSFANMSPVQAIREVAKLEIMLESGKSTGRKPPPPPPATDIRGKSEVTIDPKKLNTADFIRWRNEQQMKR